MCMCIWASLQESLILYVINKGPDQPVHPFSLISSLIFCSLENILATHATCTCKFLKILAEQAGLILYWWQTLLLHLGSINYVLQVLSNTEFLISYNFF